MSKPILIFSFLILFAGLTTAQNVSEGTDFTTQIDGTVSVTDYDLSLNSDDYVTIEAKTIGTLYITDVGSISEKGASSVNFKRVDYEAGTTNISVDATSDFGDKSLLLRKGNNVTALSNNRTSDLIGSPDGSQFVLGAIGGGISIILLIIALVKHKKWKFNKQPLQVI